jgi:membrane-associated phospholipid phosphatase
VERRSVGGRGHRPRYARRWRDAWVGLAGLVVFGLAAWGASNGRVGSWERAVFRAINGWPDWLYGPMVALQYLGVLVVGPILAVVAAALRRWRLSVAAAAATALKLVTERLVKLAVQRQRPGVVIPRAILRGNVPSRGLAFVSGHCVLTAALAMLVTPYLARWWKVAPWVVVAAVAIARVYLGAHSPLDVLGGVGLGLVIGSALNLVVGVPSPATASPPKPVAA